MRTGLPSRMGDRSIGIPPPLALALVYALLMIGGAALLMLPAASTRALNAAGRGFPCIPG